MPKSTALNFTQNVKLSSTSIENADASTLKTLFTAGTNDSVVKAIHAATTDTTARVVQLYVNDGSTDIFLGSANVAANSGLNGTTAATDIISGTLFPALPYDSNGKRVLPLPAGYVLKVATTTTVTSSKAVTVTAVAEDY